MIQIRLTEHVVLVTVYDQNLLVSTLDARGKLPYVLHINEAAAFYWRHLEDHTAPKEIIRAAAEKYHLSEEKAVYAFQLFLKQMHKRGYIEILRGENTGES